MLRAAVQLKDSTEWLSQSLEREAPQLRDCERAEKPGQAIPFRKQVQMHVRKAREAEQFFFGRGSTFGEICELLGYDEEECRSRVAAWLGECAEVLQKAEAFVDAIVDSRSVGNAPGAETREVNPKSLPVRRRIPSVSPGNLGSRESR